MRKRIKTKKYINVFHKEECVYSTNENIAEHLKREKKKAKKKRSKSKEGRYQKTVKSMSIYGRFLYIAPELR